jgi:hypothetical protein
MMTILESVQLRSDVKSLAYLCEQILGSVCVGGLKNEVVKVYRRNGIENVLAIHFHHTEAKSLAPSAIGLHVAEALRAYGLVEHSVWEEMK